MASVDGVPAATSSSGRGAGSSAFSSSIGGGEVACVDAAWPGLGRGRRPPEREEADVLVGL